MTTVPTTPIHLEGPFQKGIPHWYHQQMLLSSEEYKQMSITAEEYEKRIKSFPIDNIEEGDSVCLRPGAWEDEVEVYEHSRGLYFVVELRHGNFVQLKSTEVLLKYNRLNVFFTSHWHIQRFDLVEKLSPIDRLMQKIGYY